MINNKKKAEVSPKFIFFIFVMVSVAVMAIFGAVTLQRAISTTLKVNDVTKQNNSNFQQTDYR